MQNQPEGNFVIQTFLSVALWNGLLEESLFCVVEGMLACKQEKHAPQLGI